MKLAILALLASPALAHVALWDPSMYGYNAVGNKLKDPLINQPFNNWWFRGQMNHPPEEGVFMELPSGDTYQSMVSCDVAWTRQWVNYTEATRACTPAEGKPPGEDSGALHSTDPWATPLDQKKDLKGTAIAIAYQSDPTKIKPEDFVVISTNLSSPWVRDTEYQIPAGLPACPVGGCHCAWGWVHDIGGGFSKEIYLNFYKCMVTNPDPNGKPLPPPNVAVKCKDDKSTCTVGPKQLHYWSQAEGNNNFQDNLDPPFYNMEYGFTDGAQTDLWATSGGVPVGLHTFEGNTTSAASVSAGSSAGSSTVSASASASNASSSAQPTSGSSNALGQLNHKQEGSDSLMSASGPAASAQTGVSPAADASSSPASSASASLVQPSGTVAFNTLPSGTVPSGTVPSGTVPSGTVPSGAISAGISAKSSGRCKNKNRRRSRNRRRSL